MWFFVNTTFKVKIYLGSTLSVSGSLKVTLTQSTHCWEWLHMFFSFQSHKSLSSLSFYPPCTFCIQNMQTAFSSSVCLLFGQILKITLQAPTVHGVAFLTYFLSQGDAMEEIKCTWTNYKDICADTLRKLPGISSTKAPVSSCENDASMPFIYV